MIVIFLFGATRIKGIAKALGESVREFKKATSGESEENEEKPIITAAKKMGIKTGGKTTKQILEEMNQQSEEKS